MMQVGQKWKDVKDLFKKGHYQPLMLIYTCADAKPIDVETAPVAKIGGKGLQRRHYNTSILTCAH